VTEYPADEWYHDSSGRAIRVDRRANGQVYYVAWRVGEDEGRPLRMPKADFAAAIAAEGLVPGRAS
jgi:hypothetical protein